MEQLIKQIDDTLSAFQELFASIDDEQINVVPWEGSWTVGQLVQHMALANEGFYTMLNGPIDETSRPSDKNVESIKNIFLDFDSKMSSPDFVLPEDKNYEKEVLLQKLATIKDDLLEASWSLDLTKTCKAFEFPVFGFLTRLEALNFIIYHTKRHTWQLKNISAKLELVEM